MPPEPQDKIPAAPETAKPSPSKDEKPFVAPEPPKKPPRIVAGVDLDKVLLPKKAPPPETLMRVNAGAVLKASIPPPTAPRAPAASEMLQSLASDIRKTIDDEKRQAVEELRPTGLPRAVEIPMAPTPRHAEDPNVAAVRTYKGDIEETVREKNVSMVSIAAAQSRRNESRGEAPPEAVGASWKRYAMYGGGGALVLAALGLLAFVFLRGSSPTTSPPQNATVPLIYVDATSRITLAPNETGQDLLLALEQEREKVTLALGLVQRLYIVEPASASVSGTETEYPAPALVGLIAAHVPPALPRSLDDSYILGVHSFDGNQPFLIFKTSAYQQAYAGMLAWEPYLQADLSPLFVRVPRAHIPEEGSTTPVVSPQVTITPFNDRIVENHDARVMQNASGDILLLWSFVDRETLVIATNEYSLREAITRLKNPPLVSIPGQ